MRSCLLLPLLLCLVVGSASASFNIPSIPQQVVEVWSDWIFVSQNGYNDGDAVSVAITSSPTTMDISNSLLQFANTTREISFRIRPQVANTYTLTFQMSDGDYDAAVVKCVNRSITIEGLNAKITQGYPTEPLQFRLNTASTDDITIIPTSDTGSVTFNPPQITIPEGSLAAPFTLTASVQEPSTITYQVTGYESKYYAPIPSSYIQNIYPRDVVVGSLSTLAQVGRNSTEFSVYIPIATNSSITVTPTAVDTQFFPASANFAGGNRIETFTFVSTTPTNVARTVYFDVSGPGAADYVSTETATTGLAKKTISIHPPSSYVINKKTKLSIRIGAPVAKDVSVSLFAGNLVFTPNTVKFTDDMTSAEVEVWPTALGSDVISISVDGSDQDWYSTPASISLTIGGGSFISPDSWYVPWLWIGVESPQIPVRASVAPNTSVTLIPQAPDLVFSPSKLQFTPSQMQQYFTITPASTNTAADSIAVTSPQITWILDGPDYQLFSPPDSVSVSVQRRSLQFQWSAHLTQSTPGQLDLYLQKQYEFWATASNAPDDELTVIPTNPYITFNPSELKFSPSVLHIKVVATVEAAVGVTNIDWVIGGKSGGQYTAPAPQPVNTQLRPLSIYQAMIAPDDRVYPGQILTDGSTLSTTYLGQNHVYWFSLRSSVIPDTSFTITPKSNHITFKPTSFELSFDKALQNATGWAYTTTGAYYHVPDLYVLTSNFSVEALAPGVHEVWFELSGTDAPYYAIPSNVYVKSTQELRLASESNSANSIFAVPSLLFIIVSVLAMLL